MAEIEHKGIVRHIDGENVKVEIVVNSACDKCHLKGACHPSSEQDNRVVNVVEKGVKSYEIGEEVTLFFSEKNGLFTVCMSYIIPLVICVLALYIMLNHGVSEPVAAVISLCAIIAYFIILYIFRREIQSKIKIRIRK